MGAEQRRFGEGAFGVEVVPDAEDDFFGVEFLAGAVGGAVLGAAATFNAGEGLERFDLGEVFAGDQAEVFVALEFGDVREAFALEEDGGGAEDEVEVLGVGDEG